MNFKLSSLHLSTEFDEPIEPLNIPAVAKKGSDPALCILDGANRAPHRLARAVRRVALLGLKVANPERGARVTITLLVDSLSTKMWDRVHSENPEERVLENEFGRHRLIEVAAQGRRRGLVTLAHRPPDEKGIRQRLQFDLSGDEIGDAGLVMIGFEEPANIPAWAREDMLEDSVVGLCVANIKLEPLDGNPVAAAVSGGRPKDRANSPSKPGFFVVNRGDVSGPLEVTLVPRIPMHAAPNSGRRGRLLSPVRMLQKQRLRFADRDRALGRAEVEVVALSGEEVVKTSLSPTQEGTFRFQLPQGEEPLYVRAVRVGGAAKSRPPEWQVRLKQVP